MYISNRGFTLIELLVVISIIGLLASVVMASLIPARGKARDVRRLTDMNTIQTALEMYVSSHNSYPSSNNGNWESTGYDATAGVGFLQALVSDGELPSGGLKESNPSLNTATGNYAYYLYSAGSNGCSASRGAFYVLGIRSTDIYGANPYPTSPGFTCSGRNWQLEFSWVTGVYSN